MGIELEIINKLKDEASKMEQAVESMGAETRFARIRKNEKWGFIDGFHAAIASLELIVEKEQAQMARDYGQEG